MILFFFKLAKISVSCQKNKPNSDLLFFPNDIFLILKPNSGTTDRNCSQRHYNPCKILELCLYLILYSYCYYFLQFPIIQEVLYLNDKELVRIMNTFIISHTSWKIFHLLHLPSAYLIFSILMVTHKTKEHIPAV